MNKYEKRFNYLCNKFRCSCSFLTSKDITPKPKKGAPESLWEYSYAITNFNLVTVPKLKGPFKEENFAAAMHELGHLISFNMTKSKKARKARERRYDWSINRNLITINRLYEEFIAWIIAKYLAGNLWSDKMSIVYSISMSQYMSRFESHHPKQKSLSIHQQYMLLGGFNSHSNHITFNRHNFLKLI